MPDAEALGQIDTYHGVAYSDFWDFVDEDGAAVDVSGKLFTCHVRNGLPDSPGAIVVTVSSANGKLSVTTPTNRLAVALTAADLGPPAGLAVGDYYYELVDVTGGTAVDVIDRGWWCHRPTGVGTGA